MAKHNKWYAIWGLNGLGIYSSWDKAQKAQWYLEETGVKGFRVFSEAKRKALKEYNECADDDFEGPLPINFTLYREHIEEIRNSGLSSDAHIKVVFEDKKASFVEK